MNSPKKIRITGDGCVHDNDVIFLKHRVRVLRSVHTQWGVEKREMAKINARGKDWLADLITGTLYDPKTGRSNSPHLYLAGGGK